MSERELDCAIDTAARDMMAREPGRALSYNVMARVRGGAEPARRFAWTAAAAGIIVCAAVASVLMTRSNGMLRLPPELRLSIAETAVLPELPIESRQEPTPARVAAASVVRTTASPAAPVSSHDVSTIEPIETLPIAVAAIDVPQLEREATVIETIDIEPITIEPLAASND